MRTVFRRRTRFWQTNTFQAICGTIRKQFKKTCTDIQLKFYKAVARPSLLYGSGTWVATKRNMTWLEDAELCFLGSVTGYTRLDKIWSEVIWLELGINGIQMWDSNTNKTGSTMLKEQTTPDPLHTPSTTNNEEEETVDTPRKDGNASMPEQVNWPNPCRRRWWRWWHLINVTVLITSYAHPTARVNINWKYYHVLCNVHPRGVIKLTCASKRNVCQQPFLGEKSAGA